LKDKTRPSRKQRLAKETVSGVVELTLGPPWGEVTHWTASAMAKAASTSVSSVQRIWCSHGLQPHRFQQFKLSKTGVRFSDVRPGSPAAKAGLKGGDTMTQFGDQPIRNLYDFTAALRGSQVGDVVEVTVLREGKPLKVKVTLEQRK